MLKKFTFKFGELSNKLPLSIEPKAVTIFVGPNNSGKSLALREILQFGSNGTIQPGFDIFSAIEFLDQKESSADLFLDRTKVKNSPPSSPPGQIQIQVGNQGNWINEKQFRSVLSNPREDQNYFALHFARHHQIYLDGVNRLNLINEQPAGNASVPGTNLLQTIWLDNEKRKLWRDVVFKAFRFYPAIDIIQAGTLRIKTASREPTEDEERSYKQCAIDFHATSKPIGSHSDGVKAFTGIMLQIIAGEPELILIDEPEAFLHPSLCYLLGAEVTKYLSRRSPKDTNKHPRQLVVSTHSPEFLMGCVQAKAGTNIIRLTYEAPIATARLLEHVKLVQLMRKPILRSAKALSGLFYNSVLVTEADADRAFYQELNDRLLELKPFWGIENCLFINGNGKSNLADIAKPLRDIGIPAAIIVDIDILKEGGSNWTKFMDACKVPPLDRASFEISRSKTLEALNGQGGDFKRDGGINVLHGSDREAAQNLLSRLAEYGLFVVPRGEVENWLSLLAVNRGKQTWLGEIFEKLGEDPNDQAYVRPNDDDVWEFISQIRNWLSSPARRGV